MAEPERADRPGDQPRVLGPEHDECVAKMNRLTQERNEARNQSPSMYERAYWEVQHVLSEALGTEYMAGAGIAGDVQLLAKQRDKATAEATRIADFAGEMSNAVREFQARVAGLTRERDQYRTKLGAERNEVVALLDEILGHFRFRANTSWVRTGYINDDLLAQWQFKVNSWRPVAQEAAEPPRLAQELAEQLHEDHLAECDGSSGCQAMSHLDGCYRSLPEAEPRRPRVWQQDDLVSHCDHSDRRGIVTYVPAGKGHVYVAWGDGLSPTAHEADELVEVPSGGDSQ